MSLMSQDTVDIFITGLDDYKHLPQMHPDPCIQRGLVCPHLTPFRWKTICALE